MKKKNKNVFKWEVYQRKSNRREVSNWAGDKVKNKINISLLTASQAKTVLSKRIHLS